MKTITTTFVMLLMEEGSCFEVGKRRNYKIYFRKMLFLKDGL